MLEYEELYDNCERVQIRLRDDLNILTFNYCDLKINHKYNMVYIIFSTHKRVFFNLNDIVSMEATHQ